MTRQELWRQSRVSSSRSRKRGHACQLRNASNVELGQEVLSSEEAAIAEGGCVIGHRSAVHPGGRCHEARRRARAIVHGAQFRCLLRRGVRSVE